jgi:protein-S-isoprenylcysteine O-methyltransferase Ste14
MASTVTRQVTAVRAAVTTATRHHWAPTIAGSALALLGVVVLLVELLRYWMLGHVIHAAPVCIGCLFSFAGFFILSPARAKEGAGVVVDSTVRIAGVIRGGRRSTDTPVVVPVKTEDKS